MPQWIRPVLDVHDIKQVDLPDYCINNWTTTRNLAQFIIFWEVKHFESLFVVCRWQKSWVFFRCLAVWFILFAGSESHGWWLMNKLCRGRRHFSAAFSVQMLFVDASISKTLSHCRHEPAAVRKASSGKSLRWRCPVFYKPFSSGFIVSVRFVESANQSIVLHGVVLYLTSLSESVTVLFCTYIQNPFYPFYTSSPFFSQILIMERESKLLLCELSHGGTKCGLNQIIFLLN